MFRRILLIFIFLFIVSIDIYGSDAKTCMLKLKLANAETGETVSGVIRLIDSEGNFIKPEGLLNRAPHTEPGDVGTSAYKHYSSWWIVNDEVEISVPQKELTLEAFHGHTTELTRMAINLKGKSKFKLDVPMYYYGNPGKKGWYAGNPHLHYKRITAEEARNYTLNYPECDGYQIVFFSLLERIDRSKNYISNTYTDEDLNKFEEATGIVFGYGEEYRHNFPDHEGYGHIMLLDLDSLYIPASFGRKLTGIPGDGYTLMATLSDAREQGATNLWCHNKMGKEDIPNWIFNTVDAQLIFDTGSRAEYEETFYRYMNIGLDVPFATGTDWFLRDMAITWVRLDKSLNVENWLEALRAGRSYISNGPIMEFKINNVDIGGMIKLKKPGEVEVKGEIKSRTNFDKAELICNGEVVRVVEAKLKGNIYRAELDEKINVNESSWFALRIPPFEGAYTEPEPLPPVINEYGKPLFAHTSAIKVKIGDKWVFKPEAAKSLIKEMKEERTIVNSEGEFLNDRQKREVLKVYNLAIDKLNRQLLEEID